MIIHAVFLHVSVTGGSCPVGWDYYNGNCFYVSTSAATQPEARKRCLKMDADLASISSQDEMDFVESISYEICTFILVIGLHNVYNFTLRKVVNVMKSGNIKPI